MDLSTLTPPPVDVVEYDPNVGLTEALNELDREESLAWNDWPDAAFDHEDWDDVPAGWDDDMERHYYPAVSL